MFASRHNRDKKSRRKAVFLCAAVIPLFGLGGCVHIDPGDHPLLSTVKAFVPFGHSDVSGVAKKISFASIKLTLDGRGGLLVLEQEQPGVTYWQTSQKETVVLSRGYLSSTSGLEQNLLMTQISDLSPQPTQATPFPGNLDTVLHYRVMREWAPDDSKRTTTGLADATLECDHAPVAVKLPLATLPLVHCRETLAWQRGSTTKSDYWIDPKSNRIWKAATKVWPGGPEIRWEIARPWW